MLRVAGIHKQKEIFCGKIFYRPYWGSGLSSLLVVENTRVRISDEDYYRLSYDKVNRNKYIYIDRAQKVA